MQYAIVFAHYAEQDLQRIIYEVRGQTVIFWPSLLCVKRVLDFLKQRLLSVIPQSSGKQMITDNDTP